jgi:tetratricopeptide (TPR) repeat protein
MTEAESIELAERYCLNVLDEGERARVEEIARLDPAFREVMDDTKILLAALKLEGRDRLLNDMKHWETAHVRKPAVRTVSWQAWTAMAVAATVLITLGFYYLKPQSEMPTLSLFDSYYQPYPNVVMPAVRGTLDDSSSLAVAYQAYERGEYAKASKLLANLPEKDASVHFYLGQCYLASGETDLAVASFVTCLDAQGPFLSQSQWYLALAYLKKGDLRLAQETLEKVIQRRDSYSPKAEALLKQL